MASLEKIEGIGPVYLDKLSKAGLKTVESLLKAGASPYGRNQIALETGISSTLTFFIAVESSG